jgi:hypothetical protein
MRFVIRKQVRLVVFSHGDLSGSTKHMSIDIFDTSNHVLLRKRPTLYLRGQIQRPQQRSIWTVYTFILIQGYSAALFLGAASQ